MWKRARRGDQRFRASEPVPRHSPGPTPPARPARRPPFPALPASAQCDGPRASVRGTAGSAACARAGPGPDRPLRPPVTVPPTAPRRTHRSRLRAPQSLRAVRCAPSPWTVAPRGGGVCLRPTLVFPTAYWSLPPVFRSSFSVSHSFAQCKPSSFSSFSFDSFFDLTTAE